MGHQIFAGGHGTPPMNPIFGWDWIAGQIWVFLLTEGSSKVQTRDESHVSALVHRGIPGRTRNGDRHSPDISYDWVIKKCYGDTTYGI